MPNYLAHVEVDSGWAQITAFCAPDDQTAIQNGKDCRLVVADAYNQGRLLGVRVRICTLELGPWEGDGFATSSDRQLWDSWEQDAQDRAPGLKLKY